jgi:hypothetical protein
MEKIHKYFLTHNTEKKNDSHHNHSTVYLTVLYVTQPIGMKNRIHELESIWNAVTGLT